MTDTVEIDPYQLCIAGLMEVMRNEMPSFFPRAELVSREDDIFSDGVEEYAAIIKDGPEGDRAELSESEYIVSNNVFVDLHVKWDNTDVEKLNNKLSSVRYALRQRVESDAFLSKVPGVMLCTFLTPNEPEYIYESEESNIPLFLTQRVVVVIPQLNARAMTT